MHKISAWRTAGCIAALLGATIFGGLLALLLWEVHVPATGVAVGSILSGTFVVAALCLLLSSAVLDRSHRDSSQKDAAADSTQKDIVEINALLASMTTAINELRSTIEGSRSDLNSLGRLARSAARRMAAAEQQLAAVRKAEGTLQRVQAVVDKQVSDLEGSNVRRIR